ncbi:hypothetical protein DC31_08335 [Microbacterium sp. CH12i]|uniref:extracellular solute-binding protein n=1 Tax=Microbacterium sp. CH12i TaxID=1479651 RepID=UPI0004611234|nr:extracellular solute-binding protein [Microbacterium sp. CH12i]KDA06667.1 hypothetical protein DC31_08335 [Microbacterium sp. CH12i]
MKSTRHSTRTALRWVAALAAPALAVAALSACSAGSEQPSADDPVTIDFWGWVPGLEDLVAQWNDKNEDIQVTFHRMTGDDGQKVEAAVDAGKGPDLVQLSTHNLPEYVISERVVDITDYVSEYESNYTPASWSQSPSMATSSAFHKESAPQAPCTAPTSSPSTASSSPRPGTNTSTPPVR